MNILLFLAMKTVHVTQSALQQVLQRSDLSRHGTRPEQKMAITFNILINENDDLLKINRRQTPICSH